MTTDLKQIRARAKMEYFARRGEYTNPYPLNSPEFNEYERVWMQSLKTNGGGFVKRNGNAESKSDQHAIRACAVRKG